MGRDTLGSEITEEAAVAAAQALTEDRKSVV